MSELVLKIITPGGARGPISCDSIRLNVCDGVSGRGGGGYGIRPGHTAAMLALEGGTIRASRQGEEVLRADCGPGFAAVDGGAVTVVVEKYLEGKAPPPSG